MNNFKVTVKLYMLLLQNLLVMMFIHYTNYPSQSLEELRFPLNIILSSNIKLG